MICRNFIFFALCGVFFSFCIWPQPQPGVWKNRPEKIQLEVDDKEIPLSFIYQQDTSSKITVVQIFIKGGTRAVQVSKRGLAFLTTRLSVEMPAAKNVRDLMHLASTFLYHVDGDYSTITIESLSENIDETLEIITKILRKPLFSGLRINSIKKYMEHGQKREEDSPEQLMERTCFNTFFPGYSGSIFGDPESRKKIKKKDIVQFYNRFFNRSNMVISVSSNLEKPEVEKLVKKYFGGFPAGEPIEPQPVAVPVPGEKEFFLKKDNQQVLISFGARLPEMSRENFAMIYMLENLLGKGIGSKLWPLRAKKDLAYNLNTRFKLLKDGGLLIIYLKTNGEKIDEAYRALKKLITGVYKTGITKEELESTRMRSRADFLRDNETKIKKTRTLAYFEALGTGFDFLEAFFSYVDKTTLADFNGFLKKVLNPDQLIEVIIGPHGYPSTIQD